MPTFIRLGRGDVVFGEFAGREKMLSTLERRERSGTDRRQEDSWCYLLLSLYCGAILQLLGAKYVCTINISARLSLFSTMLSVVSLVPRLALITLYRPESPPIIYHRPNYLPQYHTTTLPKHYLY